MMSLCFTEYFTRREFPTSEMGISEIVASSLVGRWKQGGALWHWGATRTAVVTSNTATGSNNSMHDSYNSLGGTALLVNIGKHRPVY
jgi:K+-transporting ATPase A subunit